MAMNITEGSARHEVAASYGDEYHRSRHKLLIGSALYYDLKAYAARRSLFRDTPHDALVLEFGVGLGQNIVLQKRRQGYDISSFARSFSERRGIPVFSDIDAVPAGQFDVVLSSHVLEHLNDPFANLQLLATKLKPDGSLILVLPVEHHGRVPFAVDLNQHLYAWNFRTINNLLQRAGYEVLENRFRYSAGVYKLRALGKLSFALHYGITCLLGRIFNRCDMVIVARKTSRAEPEVRGC